MYSRAEDLFKLMGDETRLRILDLLYQGPVCVCQITGVLEEPQAKISRHLAKLRDADLVATLRKDQFIEYSINKENELLMQVLALLQEQHDDPALEKERSRQHLKDYYLKQCNS